MKHSIIAGALLVLAGTYSQSHAGTKFYLLAPLLASNSLLSDVVAFPRSLNFGEVFVGTSKELTATLRNVTKNKVNSELDVTGPFRLTHNCPTELPAGGSCTANISFEPTTAQSNNGAVSLRSKGIEILALSSIGLHTPAALSVSGDMSFGEHLRGAVSTKTITLTNTGQTSGVLTYGELPDSVVRSGTCSNELAAHASCTITLQWTPVSSIAGVFTAEINGDALDIEYEGTAIEAFVFNHSLGNQAQFNLAAVARSAGWNGITPINAQLTVPAGVVVGSSNTAVSAVQIDAFPAKSVVQITNHGSILGMGGAGGSSHGAGNPGGNAIWTATALSINNVGVIAGGGGGGSASVSQGATNISAGGAGGGGGQGYANSAGGSPSPNFAGAQYPQGGAGGAGSIHGPGNGGHGTNSGYYPNQWSAPWYATSLPGGNGGTWGMPGGSVDGVSGGQPGKAVESSNGAAITWISRGTVYGAIDP